MNWISSNKYQPYGDTDVSDLPARVFSKAVTRMGFKYYEVPTRKEEQWEAFLSNWLSIYKFMKKAGIGRRIEEFFELSKVLSTGYEAVVIRSVTSKLVKVKCCYIGGCDSDIEKNERRKSVGYYEHGFEIYKQGGICDIFY